MNLVGLKELSELLEIPYEKVKVWNLTKPNKKKKWEEE